MDKSDVPKMNLPIDKFCEIYNDVPNILVAYAAMVNLSADTYRQITDQVLFERENNSNYWIISLAGTENSAWLVPNPLRNVNYATIKSFPFAFDSNRQNDLKQPTSFILLEPAQVTALPTEPVTWKLTKRGAISFFLDRDIKQSRQEIQSNNPEQISIRELVNKQSPSSHVAIMGSNQQKAIKPLLLIDPQIANAWGMDPKMIQVHKGKTLASLNIEDLRIGRVEGWNEVKYIELQDLFLPELTFIDVDDALPGSLLIQSCQPLSFNNNKITPILPFHPLLLECLTPEDLAEKMQFMQDGDGVKITIILPLSGIGNGIKEYTISKNYILKEDNAIEDVPVLEIWPNIKVEGWQHYYAFYLDCNYTFNVSFSEAQKPHTYSDRNGDYIITRLSNFPTHINCQRRGYPVGFILLKTPNEQKLADTWVVGIDFGTSFTNVYVNHKGKVEPLQLENLHLKITAANVETRQPVLFESFIPEVFVPADKPLPLANILTRLGETGDEQKKVLYDSRIYVPDRLNFHPESNHIEADLGEKHSDFSRLFLEQLGLMISALAAHQEAKKIQWYISYPSGLSRSKIRRYSRLWENLIAKLKAETGLGHIYDTDNYICSENIATVRYFADKEGCNFVRSVCINLSSNTSDVSVWQSNNMIHQCSIQLGGLHLLSQFLYQRPMLIARWFKHPAEKWSNLTDYKLKTEIYYLLRYKNERWLKNDRLELEDDKNFQGLIRLMAIGTAGIYYYIGLILRTLVAEGKYAESQIPSVYVGGTSSSIFHWLDHSGTFTRNSGANELFRQMLADGSGLKEASGSETQISQRPGDEVACGLVLPNRSKLKGLDQKIQDSLIAGENCLINGQNVRFNNRIGVDDKITSIEAPKEFDRLIDFISSFNKGIHDLGIEEEIKPFKQYHKDSGLESEYAEILFKKTMTELHNALIGFNYSDKAQIEPPFILGLKALLKVLALEWANE